MAKNPRAVAEAIDEHVGQKLRMARKISGVSQSFLGQCCGLSFQQIQKFEAGSIRISAGRLMQLADVLGVPIEFFFDGISVSGTSKPASNQRLLDLAEYSRAKSDCIRLIAVADDDDIGPVREVLERLVNKGKAAAE